MGDALWSAMSGLNASSQDLDVIGNNIANSNTIGYKAQTIAFSDILSQSLSGGSSQVGSGVAVQAVQTNFTTGSFETTGNSTDMAIDGDGFFIVNSPDGSSYYTRDGSFTLDNNGDLVDGSGNKVQGLNLLSTDPTALSNISLTNVQSTPCATSYFTMGLNLNSATASGGTYNASQTVYDSLGTSHSLNLVFTKAGADNGCWGITPSLDEGATAATLDYDGLVFDTSGNLSQVYSSSVGDVTATDANGDSAAATATINAGEGGQIYQSGTIKLTRGATASSWGFASDADMGGYSNATILSQNASTITLDLNGSGQPDITLALSGTIGSGDTLSIPVTATQSTPPPQLTLTASPLSDRANFGATNTIQWDLSGVNALDMTSYSSNSTINAQKSDGYAPGSLTSLSVGTSGVITGSFTNGQTAEVAQVKVANFAAPDGLQGIGSNLYAQTPASGTPTVNNPGDAGTGLITAGSLEMSNVDISSEFINMITAQKAYEASAHVITTEDTLIEDLMNLKTS